MQLMLFHRNSIKMCHLKSVIQMCIIALVSVTNGSWNLVWEDNFLGTQLNESLWNIYDGMNSPKYYYLIIHL